MEFWWKHGSVVDLVNDVTEAEDDDGCTSKIISFIEEQPSLHCNV